MSAVDWARLQFATTSIYHFLFVPLTIGLAFLTALLHTRWYRSEDAAYLRLTRFFGALLVINIAVGVVTGLVQEFQFGTNWSGYSRFVGDVFGAPLAMEGLAAFFLESVFLGLWLFGWNRLSRRVHLATIWAVAVGSALSALFIMAANSWMQHPVGYTVNSAGHAQLTDVWALFTNPVFVWGYLQVLLASLVVGSVVMLGVSAWHLRRLSSPAVFHRSAKLAVVVLLPAIVLAMTVGDILGVIEGRYQPMKIAAAEAQWTTCQPCSFSLFQVGGGKGDETPTKIIQIPHGLSLLATNHWNGQVQGLNELNAQYQQQYGPGNYVPNVFIQYWSMRVMAYLAVLVFLLALWGAWLLARRRLEKSTLFLRLAVYAVPVPFIISIAGWMLTENGRQPWIVQGLQLTKNANSPNVGTGWIITSLVVFVLLYAILGAVDWWLMGRYARRELPSTEAEPAAEEAEEAEQADVLEFTY